MIPPIDSYEVAVRYAIDLLRGREMTTQQVDRRTAWTWALVAELQRSKQERSRTE
jgi:hypothetical protein